MRERKRAEREYEAAAVFRMNLSHIFPGSEETSLRDSKVPQTNAGIVTPVKAGRYAPV
jgi:hypothetical protein